MNGIILIDKGQGCTSFDVVRRVRSLLKIKKVGHAGTLDPFATGLLILLLGQGTKISSFLMNANKIYLASIRLGIETDTLDSTGNIIGTKRVPLLDQRRIEDGLKFFLGEIDQKPPIYSALKHQGKRAYQLARQGIQFDLKKRRIKIFQLELLSLSLPRFSVRISCSGGTYIRSLASDLARHLGTRGHLESLRRLSSGSFKVEEAYKFGQSRETDRMKLQERIIPLHQSLPDMKSFDIDNRLAFQIRNGYQPVLAEVMGTPEANSWPQGYFKLKNDAELVAIAKLIRLEEGKEKKGKLKLVRVFPVQDFSPKQ